MAFNIGSSTCFETHNLIDPEVHCQLFAKDIDNIWLRMHKRKIENKKKGNYGQRDH